MAKLKGKKVAILVTDGFEQVEMTAPREALDAEGAKTTGRRSAPISRTRAPR
jgi:protease I